MIKPSHCKAERIDRALSLKQLINVLYGIKHNIGHIITIIKVINKHGNLNGEWRTHRATLMSYFPLNNELNNKNNYNINM